ncbi:MAG: 4a-hydroxytetrahydrobiopterin dehydratase [Phycisphaerales bacterium]
MKPTKLTDAEVREHLKRQPDWALSGGQIERTFVFKDFVASMAFVQKIAEYAERVQHHPNILIRWNKVTLSVNTHDCGGISIKDFDLAAAVNGFGEGV